MSDPATDPLAQQPFPLTDLQQAYAIGQSEALDLGGLTAVAYGELDFAELDLDRFEQALRRVIARHEMLRAVILEDGTQRVLSEVPPYTISRLDLRGLPPGEAAARLEELRLTLRSRCRPLDRWPLIELRACLLDGQRTRIQIVLPLAVVDGVSKDILFADLFRYYRDPAAELPPLSLSFRDCVLAMQPEPAALEKARAYWLGRLATLPPAPELPLCGNPASLRGHRFVPYRAEIPAAVWQQLRERAAQRGFTPAGFILSAYAEVLGAWSKSPRFTIVFLRTERRLSHPQVYNVIGNFTSTFLIEVDQSKPSFFARALALNRQIANDLDHSEFSGVQVLRQLIQGGGGVRALMPCTAVSGLFGALKRPVDASELDFEIPISMVTVPQVLVDHAFFERPSGALILALDVVDQAFPPGLGQAMITAYRDLLLRLAEGWGPWMKNGGLPLPPDQLARRQAANATSAPVPAGLLHDALEARAAEDPGALAVISGARSLDFAELTARAGVLSHELHVLGVKPEELVAVVMEKGWEQAVAVLAVLEAGGAYLPIDAGLPPDRQRLLLEQARARVAICQPGLDRAPARWPSGLAWLVVEGPAPDARLPRLPPAQRPEELAYVIFTSGSTGLPKGVMIDHRGALNTCVDLNQRFRVGPADRVLGLSALNFDLSVYDIFGVLGAGGALVLPDAERRRDPEHWLDLVCRHRVTIWNTVPTLAQMLVDHVEELGTSLPEHLRLVMMSGDWIPVTLPERLRACASGPIEIYSLGGATEASIWSIYYRIDRVDPSWRSIPYGRPMLNQSFHVLDSHLEPRPEWVPGQLHIGGVGLARGYLHDPEKTARAFIQHPVTGERLYRTGDLGRYRDDGEIEFLGREDSQVKVRGYRIELGEIESVLAQHPGVREAVVIVRERDEERARARNLRQGDPGAPGPLASSDKVIVGYLVPTAPGLDLDLLRAHLEARLPEYMIPSALILLDRVPLTGNGKVDRRALPTPGFAAVDARALVPPRDEVERQIAEIWQQALGLDSLGVTEDFFALGGHSALAVRVLTQVRRRFGVSIPLSAIFQGSTVEQLARLVRARDELRASCLVEIATGAGSARPPFFCVHPVSGSVLCYADLSRALGDRPFLGLQARGLLRGQTPQRTIEEMASCYLAELRERQPVGPYHLGGWSMGGIIALEMARQLEGAGQVVARVAVIDALIEETGSGRVQAPEHYVEWFARDLAGMASRSVELPREALAGRALDEQLELLFRALSDAGISPFSDLEGLRPYFETFHVNALALELVRLRPCPVPFAVFEASERAAPGSDWAALAPAGHRLERVEGNHFSLMRPPLCAGLARALAAYLDEA